MKLQGAFTAMITPFTASGEVDWKQLINNVDFQIQQGIDGLVPCGTTGESPTLNHNEHSKVIEEVAKAARGRVPVIAGTGSNSTAEAVALTRHAKDAGVTAVLSVNPYYNKPTQEGLYRHFMQVAEVGVPVLLYNIPGRTGIALTPSTIARLAAHPNIIGDKEATGSMEIASEVAKLCDPEKFTILSGDDMLTLPLMSIGGKGVISVLSNLLPARVKALADAILAGDYVTARKLHLAQLNLCQGMFIETNPIPVKTAMKFKGMDTGVLRLPMCEMEEANVQRLKKLLQDEGVI
ncbi:4-hydroxy-tetrahydrodipicolinate synthase [bacterium AH-315-I18]|nr:4-hydroxy-tetrahydrodipicolinate synthase [Phycisphaeraceae bacterium]MBN4060878.1 4-hydroxy-tetrahydrodipicolinate synthase [bacterium AH-315-I18]